MKVSVKFIWGFCRQTWQNRYEYWAWYWNNLFEESLAVLTYLALC